MYTFNEAKAVLGISTATLNILCKTRRIGFYQQREGCARKFSDKHIEKYLESTERVPRTYIKGGRGA